VELVFAVRRDEEGARLASIRLNVITSESGERGGMERGAARVRASGE